MQSCAKSWGIFLAKSVNPGAPCRRLSDKSRVVPKLQWRIRRSGASSPAAARGLRTSAAVSSRQIERILPRHDDFAERHIGPGEREKRDMLDALGVEVRSAATNPAFTFKPNCSGFLKCYSALKAAFARFDVSSVPSRWSS